MVQITINDLKSLRNKYRDKKIVFCSGSFDLTHAGHVLFFEDCKNHGDILVVGIGGDRIIKLNKGNNRPILNENVRLKMIDSLKPVDYCFLDTVSDETNNNRVLEVALRELKPDFYIVNEDAFGMDYRKRLCQENNVSLLILERTCPENFDNISTSQIIEKISSK